MDKKAKNTQAHPWHYFRAGGMIQVSLNSGADLSALAKLDKKLWAALACPTTGLYFDNRTLSLIDVDNDGRIRASELINATTWVTGLLKNPDHLLRKSPLLELDDINDASVEGKAIIEAARELLVSLGKADAKVISVDDTLSAIGIFNRQVFNGDGVITGQSTTDESLKALINDIIACFGPDIDRSGLPGVSRLKTDRFFAEATAYADWLKKCPDSTKNTLSEKVIARAADAVTVIQPKVEDYFVRCRLAAYDERCESSMNLSEKEYAELAAKNLTINSTELTALPLAHAKANRPLPLDNEINPAWHDAVMTLREHAVKPLIGECSSLCASDWRSMLEALGPYFAHQAEKPQSSVEKLGASRICDIVAGDLCMRLNELIDKDTAKGDKTTAFASLEKLLLFHRDLYQLCTNFVNFRDFYCDGGSAIFRAGSLYIDQRCCELCLHVNDVGKHASMAALAGTYLAYCDCVRKSTGEIMQIVAAITDGDSDNLMVGRNGIFYDRSGNDWDATIIRIIDNPISLRQAFWSPYKNFVRMIEEQIAKRAAVAQAESTIKLENTASVATAVSKTKLPEPSKKLDIGVVAAVGVAAGAIGTFLATIFGHIAGIVKLGPFAIVGLIFGIISLISGPSLILATIKLRKRNLGPILDANGWAVNSQAKINVPFGTTLTRVAKVPLSVQRHLSDPFAQKRSPWPAILIVTILIYAGYAVLNYAGFVFEWTGGRIGTKRDTIVHIQSDTSPVHKASMPTSPEAPTGK